MRHSKETLERKRCYGEEIPKTNRSGEAMSSGGGGGRDEKFVAITSICL